MKPAELRALQAQILDDPACKPYIITNDMPRVSGKDALEKDAAIAVILNAGRTKLISCMVTERGVRANLSIRDGALFIKTLRDLDSAKEVPEWLSVALDKVGVHDSEKWAYFDTFQCGYSWLRADGLDVGDARVRKLLDLLGLGVPDLSDAVASLKDMGVEDDKVNAGHVSLALRGPWGDE